MVEPQTLPTGDGAPSKSVDLVELQGRYNAACGLLQRYLLSGFQFKKDHRDQIRSAIELRRSAADVLNSGGSTDAVEPDLGKVLSAFENALKQVPDGDPDVQQATEQQLDRFVAWYNGDGVASVPPALPQPKEPAAQRDRPAASGQAEDTSEGAGPESEPSKKPTARSALRAPRKTKPAVAVKPRRWLRRTAALLILAVAVSAMRAPDRRNDLGAALATGALFDVRSLDDMGFWFRSVSWTEAGGRLANYAWSDARIVGNSGVAFMASFMDSADLPRAEVETVAAEGPKIEAADAPDIAVEPPTRPGGVSDDTGVREPVLPAATDQPSASETAAVRALAEERRLIELEAKAAERAAQELRRQTEFERQIEELRRALQVREGDLNALNIQVQSLGEQLNTALARLAKSDRENAGMQAKSVALLAEREILLQRIANIEPAAVKPSDPALTPQPTVRAQATHLVDRPRVNARSGPGTSFGIVTSLPQGTPIALLEESNGWGKFRLLEEQASDDLIWVALSLLRAAE